MNYLKPIWYSPIMGMGLGDDIFANSVAVVIEDYMFESTTANELVGQSQVVLQLQMVLQQT